jgi:hypothetical protein
MTAWPARSLSALQRRPMPTFTCYLRPARENETIDELAQHVDDRWRELASPDSAYVSGSKAVTP